MTLCQSSPVEHWNSRVIALPKFWKFLYLLSMALPGGTPFKMKTSQFGRLSPPSPLALPPNTAKMKKTSNRSAPTFTRLGSANIKVSISFCKPLMLLTSFKKRVILRLLVRLKESLPEHSHDPNDLRTHTEKACRSSAQCAQYYVHQ